MQESPLAFICYADEDEKAARKLYEDMKQTEGINLWFNRESLLPGQNWRATIKQAIKNSRYFLAVLSSNSVTKKGYVQKEITIALDLLDEFPELAVFVIPVRLDNCKPSHEKLRDLHWVDMFPSWEDGLKKVIRAIQAEEGALAVSDKSKVGEKEVSTPQKDVVALSQGSTKLFDNIHTGKNWRTYLEQCLSDFEVCQSLLENYVLGTMRRPRLRAAWSLQFFPVELFDKADKIIPSNLLTEDDQRLFSSIRERSVWDSLDALSKGDDPEMRGVANQVKSEIQSQWRKSEFPGKS